MKIKDQNGLFLNIVEKSGTDKNGTTYDYRQFNFCIEEEGKSRRTYLDTTDGDILVTARHLEWGDRILISGELDDKNNLRVTDIVKSED